MDLHSIGSVLTIDVQQISCGKWQAAGLSALQALVILACCEDSGSHDEHCEVLLCTRTICTPVLHFDSLCAFVRRTCLSLISINTTARSRNPCGRFEKLGQRPSGVPQLQWLPSLHAGHSTGAMHQLAGSASLMPSIGPLDSLLVESA